MTSETAGSRQPPIETAGRKMLPQEPEIAVLTGRPRSVPGEEAYLRSELERAAIDIAAGL